MRAILVIIALGFSMAIMISVPAGIVSNQEATQNLTANFNSTISNMQAEINETATLIECQTSSRGGFQFGMPSGMPPNETPGSQETTYINETVTEEIRSIAGVKNVVEFLEASSEETTSETITGPGGRTFTISRSIYTITGVSLNSSLINTYSILPTNITEGRCLQEGDSSVVIMTSNLTSYLGIGLGDKAEIYGKYFTVVGIYESATTNRMQARALYMNVSDAQTVTGLTGDLSRLDVYAENSSAVDGIADVINAAYSDIYITTYKDRLQNLENMQEGYTETLSNAQSTLSQTQATATQEVIISVAATSLIVLFVMLYTVRERTKEIGTFKAIGFSNMSVMTQFVLEGVLLSIMAGVVGVAIGYFAAPTLSSLLLPHVSLFGGSSSGGFRPISGTPTLGATATQTAAITLNPQLMFLAFGVAIMLGALGSLYPAWRAARIKPAEAMRYE